MRDLVHAYADGELDLARSLEMEQHLRACEACSGTLRDVQALRSSLHEAALYFRAPARMRRRAGSALRRASWTWWSIPARPLRWASAGAALTGAAALTWTLVVIPAASDARALLTQELISDHQRSLMPGRLTDVRSSDRHAVKPWFGGKIDFSPPVRDLAGLGYPLLGGRVDYLEGRRVAALVYRRHRHVINVFVRPASGEPDRPAAQSAQEGYNIIHWTRGGMAYAAVSDLNESELLTLALEFQH